MLWCKNLREEWIHRFQPPIVNSIPVGCSGLWVHKCIASGIGEARLHGSTQYIEWGGGGRDRWGGCPKRRDGVELCSQ